MLRSTLHTIMTHRFAVGLSAVALLGGGAALASPAGPFDLLPDDVPLEVVPPDDTPVTPDVVPSVDPEVELPVFETLVDPEEVVGEDLEVPEGTEENEVLEEDDGNAWALGRSDGDDQQTRVEAFCEERIAVADAADVEGAEADAEAVGVPPFCTAGPDGGPVAPNAHGKSVAEQARTAERPQGGGPPEWANSNRPDDVPPGPPNDVPRGNGENEIEDLEDDIDAAGEPAGGDVEPGGPPAHANPRANRG